MNFSNLKKNFCLKLLYTYSYLINFYQSFSEKKQNIKHKFNQLFFKNKLTSVECINLDNNKITFLFKNYIFSYTQNNYKLNNFNSKLVKNSNNIFMINFCNYKGQIISFIITNKQFRILSKNKHFINHAKLISLINTLNSNNHHINLLHSAICDIEITSVSQKYIKSLNNITVNNFIKFLKIKNYLYIDTMDSDLIVMDSDFLDEYTFKTNDIIKI
jgi:hypothetical protein